MNKAIPLSAETKTLVLSVEGMTCAACAARIERVLTKEKSVKDVVVNFPLKKVILEVNPEDNNSDEYIQRIRSALGIGSLIIFVFGRKFHVSALKNIKKLNFNMDTLISIGSLSSFAIGILPNNGELMYLETGGFIISFILLGKTIEDISIKSSVSVSDTIIESIPKDVNVYENQITVRKPLNQIEIGDVIIVKKGEIIPLDGVIIRGSSEVDVSVISGECPDK